MKKVGYKVFKPDWKCLDFQYEVGKTYIIPNEEYIEICSNGFHFCENLIDCFNYYSWNPENKVALINWDDEVEFQIKDDKICTRKITIVREIEWNEVFKLCNSGLNCTGRRNSGNGNSGHRNSGNWNSGNGNSGDWNSGDWNSGNGNSGLLNSETPKVVIFDMQTELCSTEVYESRWYKVLCNVVITPTDFIYESDMTDLEKTENPHYKTLGGYIKTLDYKKSFSNGLKKLSLEDIESLKTIPNWNPDKFFNITGFRIE